MKRSPMKRGTKGLARTKGLTRGTGTGQVKPPPKTRKPLPARSARRTAELAERAEVRAFVLARDDGCIAVDLVPEVRCGSPDPRRPALEVDELRGGSYRSTEYLDPEACNTLCQAHHDWKTDHKREFIDRLTTARSTQENPDG